MITENIFDRVSQFPFFSLQYLLDNNFQVETVEPVVIGGTGDEPITGDYKNFYIVESLIIKGDPSVAVDNWLTFNLPTNELITFYRNISAVSTTPANIYEGEAEFNNLFFFHHMTFGDASFQWELIGYKVVLRDTISPILLKVDYDGITQCNLRIKLPIGFNVTIFDGDGTVSEIAGTGANYNHFTSYVTPGTYYFYLSGDYTKLETFNLIGEQYFVSGNIERYYELTNINLLFVIETNFYGDLAIFGENFKGSAALGFTKTQVTFSRVVNWGNDPTRNISIIAALKTSEEIDNLLVSMADNTGAIICTGGINRTARSDAALLNLISNKTLVVLSEIAPPSGIALGAELHTLSNAIADPNGTEADSIAGWTPTGLGAPNVFESQGAVKAVGGFAFHVNSNPAPTANNQIQLTTPLTVVTNEVYRIAFKVGFWESTYKYYTDIHNVSIDYFYNNPLFPFPEFQNVVAYRSSPDTTMEIRIREGSSANNGEFYIDDLSVKRVTII